MSFRLRVLALVALVAVTATAVTAWATLDQASRQVNRQVPQDSGGAEHQEQLITEALTDYGRTHATWEGVADTVARLAAQIGQRIRVVNANRVVLVDTDTLAGRTARDVESLPLLIDVRPVLALSADLSTARDMVEATLAEIDNYRSGVLFAACLTRAGVPVEAIDGPHGVPRYTAATTSQPDLVDHCTISGPVWGELEAEEDAVRVELCTDPTIHPEIALSTPMSATARQALAGCLADTFSTLISEGVLAPVPLHVYIGAVDVQPAALSSGPILAAAGLIAALAVAGSLLVSQRVVRPIRALTSASYRLGKGDLSRRVPVVGRDELATLARSFNRMADSLQHGEERQRRLIADVAHELRTPLANLRGYLEALRDGVVSPGPEVFASLHEEAVLQQRIVDDLQDLALAEAGALVYHRSRVDLAELLEICRTAHQAVAETAGVRLAVSAEQPGCVEADPDRLRQVLGNLVSNALRATPSGGSITLAARRDGAYAVIEVIDTGTGIQPAQLPYVFDRFWRADAARGRDTGGSGLGLAIARQIVTDHGGTIQVASEPGAGTAFVIRLPSSVR